MTAARMAVRIAAGLLAGLGALWAGGLWPGGSGTPAGPADRALAPIAVPAGPADAPLRIVAFGTSLTAGPGWPEALEAGLAACLGRPVALTRVAGPGQGTAWALTRTDRVIAAGPDLVLIEFAINDADLRDGIGLAASRANHMQILDRLAAGLPGAQLVLLTMNPVVGPLRRLQRPFLADYDAMLRELAAARGLGLADLAPRWRAAIAADPALAPPDGLHPTPAAAARVVAPPLAALIGAAAGRAC